MEVEQVGPSTLPSLTNLKNLNLNLGQDGTSITQPVENPKKSDKVRPLSLEPFLDKHACDLHKTYKSGKEVRDESSIMG